MRETLKILRIWKVLLNNVDVVFASLSGSLDKQAETIVKAMDNKMLRD